MQILVPNQTSYPFPIGGYVPPSQEGEPWEWTPSQSSLLKDGYNPPSPKRADLENVPPLPNTYPSKWHKSVFLPTRPIPKKTLDPQQTLGQNGWVSCMDMKLNTFLACHYVYLTNMTLINYPPNKHFPTKSWRYGKILHLQGKKIHTQVLKMSFSRAWFSRFNLLYKENRNLKSPF